MTAHETQLVGSTIMKGAGGRPSWKNRRKIIFASLLFCAFCIMFIMFQGNDTRVNESIVLGSFMLAGSVIGTYVFGATWQDLSIEKIKSTTDVNRSMLVGPATGVEPEIIQPEADEKGSDDD